METTRKILSACISFLLAITLFLGITSFAITSYLGNSENIKQTLNDSGIYDSLVNNITSAIKKEAQQEQGQPSNKKEDLPLDNPEVQAAINKAFPPSFWQKSAEQIIDGAYRWLDGDSSKLQFKIELKQAKATLVTSLADYVVARTEKLPVCTSPEQIPDPDDAFNLPCRPPDFNTQAAREKFIADASQTDLLGTSDSFDASNLANKDSNQPIEEQLAPLKQGYTFSKMFPKILALFAVLLSIALFFLQKSREAGFTKLRNTYVSVGASILIFTAFAWFMFKKVSGPSIKLGGGEVDPVIQRSALSATNSVFDSITKVLFIGALSYLVIGGICWLITRKMRGPVSEEQIQNNVNTVLKTKELTDENAANIEDTAEGTKESQSEK